jgi:predicted MPP superfamily phosphohydrolase
MEIIMAIVVLIILLCVAFYDGLTVKYYAVGERSLNERVRILQISDLHGHSYSKDQRRLISIIQAQAPDVVVMTGDIADEKKPLDGVRRLLEAVGERYICFYVTGNHEYYKAEPKTARRGKKGIDTEKAEGIKDLFRGYGVRVLDGRSESVCVKGRNIRFCGVDDSIRGDACFKSQLECAFAGDRSDDFTVLLAHRPERVAEYMEYDCDLVFSGHAHGGQWRVPYVVNGLFAPQQGFFPKYAGGLYKFGGKTMIVSRGLSKDLRPRLFNRTEVVVADV